MLHLFRRHRLHLGRSLAGLLALAWMTVALQPCAMAQGHHAAPAHAAAAHHHHGHDMPASHQDAQQEKAPCAPGADCPVFKAVDGQAATKAADPAAVPAAPAPAFHASWPAPVSLSADVPFDRTARLVLPAPPILESRVLLI